MWYNVKYFQNILIICLVLLINSITTESLAEGINKNSGINAIAKLEVKKFYSVFGSNMGEFISNNIPLIIKAGLIDEKYDWLII
ncbi:MAG: hypothetical protein KAQ90_06735, partial [Melioribacteraceae bacterium]|nr:hypothetical protein [Melioribacteraceae bacterium]